MEYNNTDIHQNKCDKTRFISVIYKMIYLFIFPLQSLKILLRICQIYHAI